MAEPLPAALRIPEVSRFINRANQLRTIKPAIAYWCEYHAVNQIVGKSLHTADDEAFNFTKTLIERLETTKAERADDDAIVDNTAGQAYVEQFAQQTFDRAERTLRANKVTRQTADTFDAAATFFDLTNEWGTPDPETLQKIKFAKWNAARILKAIRNGEDPNESNPKQPEPEASPILDPTDPEFQEISGSGAQPASIQDVPDAGEPSSMPQFIDEPPRPSAEQQGYFPMDNRAPEPFIPSPLSQSPTPTPMSGMPPPPLPPVDAAAASMPRIPPQPSPHIPTKLPHQFGPPPPSPPVVPSGPPAWSAPTLPSPAPVHPPPPMHQPSAPSYAAPTPTYSAPPPAAPAPMPSGSFTTNQKDINQAQKHAKWAISALNFEDVSTAVTELRNALALLGAR
ncbi:Fc.00g024730.m01.CDS01 [Cosmosporella sp. VM-42]